MRSVAQLLPFRVQAGRVRGPSCGSDWLRRLVGRREPFQRAIEEIGQSQFDVVGFVGLGAPQGDQYLKRGTRVLRRFRCYRTLTVSPPWLIASPILMTTGTLPDGTESGIRTLIWSVPSGSPGAAPAYEMSVA